MFGYLFNQTTLIGTLAVVIGLIALALKNSDDGREWIAGKFGENWEKKAIVAFLGWPLVIIGFTMFLPDHFFIDLFKLGIAFVAFLGWRMYKRKKEANKGNVTGPQEHSV